MGAKWLLTASLLLGGVPAAGQSVDARVELGPRPQFLVDDMRDGPLKTRLASLPRRSRRGARRSRSAIAVPAWCFRSTRSKPTRPVFAWAPARSSATSPSPRILALVCRHSQNDLATTTDILLTPLAQTCVEPFTPAELNDERCRRAARESRVPHERAHARRVQVAARQDRRVRSGCADRRAVRDAATGRTPGSRRGLPSAARCSRMPRASRCFERLGVQMTPELKEPSVELPFNGLTRDAARPKAHRRVSQPPVSRRAPSGRSRSMRATSSIGLPTSPSSASTRC